MNQLAAELLVSHPLNEVSDIAKAIASSRDCRTPAILRR
jgi:hypothetical protein